MKLSIAKIKAELKNRTEKARKVADGGGLYLLVPPTGNGRWRFKYRVGGKEKKISLGTYPDISLKDAREKHQELRKKHAQGIDLVTEKRATQIVKENTFEAIAREWHGKKVPHWNKKHGDVVLGRLERFLFPFLGALSAKEVTSPLVLGALFPIEEEGKGETAHRVRSLCGQVMRYAVATGRADSDPTEALRGALMPPKSKHLAAIIEPAQFALLLQAIDRYTGTATAKWALRLSPLVFLRPGELRQAEWIELDFAKSIWTVPACKMKGRKDHIVPLARQAVEIFKEAQQLNGQGKYVFPSILSASRPISENTVNTALRRMDFAQSEHCAHGFRASARTMLDEVLHQRPDLIEHQLAHAVRGPLGRAYNRAQFLDERKVMMQLWADYLDNLKSGSSS